MWIREGCGETSLDFEAFSDSFLFDSLGCAAAPWLGHDPVSAATRRTVCKPERATSYVAARGARMNASHRRSSPPMLARGDSDPNARADLVGHAWQILLPLMAVAGLIALWVATAPSASNVGQERADLNRWIVQHQKGAVARAIQVRDGEGARAERLFVMGERVRSDANLLRLQYELRAARVLGR